EPLVEALALEELHHQIRRAILRLSHVVDIDDGSVLDLAASARLQEEAIERLLVLRERGEQEFDREVAIRELIPRSPNRPHPSRSEESKEAVLARGESAGFHGRTFARGMPISGRRHRVS